MDYILKQLGLAETYLAEAEKAVADRVNDAIFVSAQLAKVRDCIRRAKDVASEESDHYDDECDDDGADDGSTVFRTYNPDDEDDDF